jgi:DNA-binding transcriptional LysR family regulator
MKENAGMDLEEFRAFLAVVETGSFLAAATQLNTPRATLRRRVEALEARAGVLLLERSARGVVVTAAGAVLADRGRVVLQEASALVASVREIGREPVGVLRALVPVGLPPHAIGMIVAAMRTTYPRLGIQLRMCEDPWRADLDDVELLAYFGSQAPPGSWLTFEVMRTREWLVASADYLRRRGTPGRIEDLAGHELLSWCAPGEDGRVWPTLAGEGFEVEPALISADVHMIRQMVLMGLGIGLVPDAQLPDPGVEPGTIVPVLPALVGRERSLHVAVPAALAGLPKLRALVRQIQGFAERGGA